MTVPVTSKLLHNYLSNGLKKMIDEIVDYFEIHESKLSYAPFVFILKTCDPVVLMPDVSRVV